MRTFIAFVVFFTPVKGLSQSTNAPINEVYYWDIDRYEVKSGRIAEQLFTSVKPYRRSAITAFIDTLSQQGLYQSKSDRFIRQYLRNDSWEWSRDTTVVSNKPVWKKLYRTKPDFFHVDEPSFDLHVSPVLYLGIGRDSRLDDIMFINTRGFELRGIIDRKLGFYTFITDNQMILPSYVQEGIATNPVIPHEGFWKDFKSNGVDFLHARGYISFDPTQHINFQFGHDRTFIGNGFRSLILSDFSAPNLFLRAQVKVWKLNYLYQINQLTAQAYGTTSGSKSGVRYPEKFMAFHHLSFNIGKKLNLGFFESVVLSPKDSLSRSTLDLGYLNPVIFFRAIEHQSGSSDNVLIGADFKWIAAKKLEFYGQVVFDEFLLEEIKAGDGWWGNKFAIQGGLKLIDVGGISNLDLLVEANVARPYTYSHGTKYGSYSHFNQPLAHPLGANFLEEIALIRYQPIPRLKLSTKIIFAKTGRDDASENWGADILKDSNTRQSNYGNSTAQGNSQKIFFVDFTASYMVWHNLFFDLEFIQRRSESSLTAFNNNTSITSLALRWNIPQRSYEF